MRNDSLLPQLSVAWGSALLLLHGGFGLSLLRPLSLHYNHNSRANLFSPGGSLVFQATCVTFRSPWDHPAVFPSWSSSLLTWLPGICWKSGSPVAALRCHAARPVCDSFGLPVSPSCSRQGWERELVFRQNVFSEKLFTVSVTVQL